MSTEDPARQADEFEFELDQAMNRWNLGCQMASSVLFRLRNTPPGDASVEVSWEMLKRSDEATIKALGEYATRNAETLLRLDDTPADTPEERAWALLGFATSLRHLALTLLQAADEISPDGEFDADLAGLFGRGPDEDDDR